ncbi:MAG TPA: D-aminoacyl-tRNA deacylase [Gaiellaceae bacterium]
MRAVCQRVTQARVTVDGSVVAAIGPGLLVLVGVARDDTDDVADRLATRVARLRVFEGDTPRFDRSVVDVGGEALVVSQFTLITDPARKKGARPDFSGAARPDTAEPIYDRFRRALAAHGITVRADVFGARMQVELVNDGPVTIILDA